MRGGRRSTSFRPGVSGNPRGRPKKARTIEARRLVTDVKAAARELTQSAIDTLARIMKNPKAPAAVRLSAAQALLDRGHGRPSQAVDVVVETYDYSRLTNDQLDELERLMMMIEVPSEGQSLAMLVDGQSD
jgi:hypothetical protein